MRKYSKMTKWYICWDLIHQYYKQTQLNSSKISFLLDGTYHVNQIKKGSPCTPQGIVSTFDGYEKALKNTLLNKFAIETPDNKIQEVTLKGTFLVLLWITPQFIAKRSIIPQFRKKNKVNYREEDKIINSLQSCTSLECSMYRTSRDDEIDIMR